MKNVFYFFLISLFFTACGGSKKSLDQGDYYTAVYKAVKSLQKNATKEKNILALQEAYPKANAKDLKRVSQLKLDGDPQSWDKIYNIYKSLDSRQDLVQTVTPLYLNGQEIDFEYKNYQKNMAEAKLRAAQFYYNHAKQLMQNDDQVSNRKAYNELLRVKTYFSSYEDTDQLLEEARYLGTSHILISIKNEAHYKFGRAYLAELLNFGIADLNSTWKNYYTNFNENTNYDYDITVIITNLKTSDAIRERSEYTDKKERLTIGGPFRVSGLTDFNAATTRQINEILPRHTARSTAAGCLPFDGFSPEGVFINRHPVCGAIPTDHI